MTTQDVETVPPHLSVLDQLWQDVLTLVTPFPTQMMLRQQCRLLDFDGWTARIGTTSLPLFKMANDRMPNIELAFAQLCDHPIKVSLEVVPVNASVPVVPIYEAIAPGSSIMDLEQLKAAKVRELVRVANELSRLAPLDYCIAFLKDAIAQQQGKAQQRARRKEKPEINDWRI